MVFPLDLILSKLFQEFSLLQTASTTDQMPIVFSAKFLLAFVFIFSISQHSDAQDVDYCIADEQATDDMLYYAMRWACTNGADCTAIQDWQTCFLPNTTTNHASYAFNSYYQNTKHSGGSCYFTAAAILTDLDPSHDSCKFGYLP